MEPGSLPFLWLIPFLPLVGSLGNLFFGSRLPRAAVNLLALGSVFASFALSVLAFLRLAALPPESRVLVQVLFPWIRAGSLDAPVAYVLDPLSGVMILVVTGVGFLIHVYSVGYMAHDRRYSRYFAFLNLFVFAMLTLVLGENVFLMFIGWEGVGLCSYLLIGFWFEETKNASAGKKAFLVNRVGDFGFLVGIFALFWSLSAAGAPTMSFRGIAANAHLLEGMTLFGMPVATFVTLCFFLGATGKSAQIPLYIWLPDAMAGPTPVSALIHAATMVTAGVYMIGRLAVLFALSPVTLAVVASVGCLTALLAATIAITQTDIKRVLAYSTVSQLGTMFVGMGVAAFSAGIFHLMTHAFFKALLFLGAGSVIHAMSGEQDMSRMGGLRKHLPVTYRTMLVATLAIAGLPGLSGFFSKDEILWQAFSSPHGSPLLWAVCVATAGMTAFYMFRLLFRTFFGTCRADERTRHHLHESPRSMTVPLVILAVLAVVGGYVGVPAVLGRAVGAGDPNVFHHFLEPSFAPPDGAAAEGAPDAHGTSPATPPEGAHAGTAGAEPHGGAHPAALELGLMAISVIVALLGIALAHLFYVRRPELPERAAARLRTLYALSRNKYYVDEIYEAAVVRPVLALTRLSAWFDLRVIDAVVNGVGRLSVLVSFVSGRFDDRVVDGAVNLTGTAIVEGGRSLKTFQTGKIQNYLMVVLLGVLVMILIKAL